MLADTANTLATQTAMLASVVSVIAYLTAIPLMIAACFSVRLAAMGRASFGQGASQFLVAAVLLMAPAFVESMFGVVDLPVAPAPVRPPVIQPQPAPVEADWHLGTVSLILLLAAVLLPICYALYTRVPAGVPRALARTCAGKVSKAWRLATARFRRSNVHPQAPVDLHRVLSLPAFMEACSKHPSALTQVSRDRIAAAIGEALEAASMLDDAAREVRLRELRRIALGIENGPARMLAKLPASAGLTPTIAGALEAAALQTERARDAVIAEGISQAEIIGRVYTADQQSDSAAVPRGHAPV